MAGRRSALIVATDQYSDPKLKRLRSPSIDAAELARVLEDPGIGDFAVELSTNEDEASIRRRLSRFFRTAGREDLLLLHIAGHGVKDDDGQLYFATADSDTNDLIATAVNSVYIEHLMAGSPSRRIVLLLDCCYSGAFARGMRARGDPDIHVMERLGGRGRAVLTASGAMEYAWEGDDVAGEGLPSVFTGAVVRGLATGEADRDGDGDISVDDLYDYVLEQVRDTTPKQTPNKQIQAEGGLLIAKSVNGPRISTSALGTELLGAMQSPLAGVRAGAVTDLSGLLHGGKPAIARAARVALQELAQDDSRRVSAAAENALADMAATRQGIELSALYADARLRSEAGAWKEALNILGRIRTTDPSYPGLAELEAATRGQLAAVEREKNLDAAYDQALEYLRNQRWAEALAVIQELQGQAPGYRDSGALLRTAQEGLQREEHDKPQQAFRTPQEVSPSARAPLRDRWRVNSIESRLFTARSMADAIRQAEAAGATDIIGITRGDEDASTTAVSRGEGHCWLVSFVATRVFTASSMTDAIRQAEAAGATEIVGIARDDDDTAAVLGRKNRRVPATKRVQHLALRKLTEDQEREVTRLYAETETPTSEIAKRFGISESTVPRVAQRHGASVRGRANSG
jgi:hypothetical protein